MELNEDQLVEVERVKLWAVRVPLRGVEHAPSSMCCEDLELELRQRSHGIFKQRD